VSSTDEKFLLTRDPERANPQFSARKYRGICTHSDSEVTERYIHGKGSNLDKVAQIIQLLPNNSKRPSKNLPKTEGKEMDGVNEAMLTV
jgi:hypothetical protein